MNSKDLLDHQNLQSARLVMMCGLPGSGKSTLAGYIADSFQAELISSDRIRAKIFTSSHYANHGDNFYLGIKSKLYSVLFDEAQKYLKSGKKVVIDATNLDKQRDVLIERFSVFLQKNDILIIIVNTPKTVIADRLRRLKKSSSSEETYFEAWQRVYAYFEMHLADGLYYWPNNIGIKMLKVQNG